MTRAPANLRNAARLQVLASLVLRPCQWDATAAAWSRAIPHDFPGNYPEQLKEMVTSGQAQLAEIRTDHGPAGIVVWSLVETEFLLVAMAGRDGSDLTEQCAPAIERFAREQGAKTIRFHTMRPGLVRKTQTLGWRISEIILRKDLY